MYSMTDGGSFGGTRYDLQRMSFEDAATAAGAFSGVGNAASRTAKILAGRAWVAAAREGRPVRKAEFERRTGVKVAMIDGAAAAYYAVEYNLAELHDVEDNDSALSGLMGAAMRYGNAAKILKRLADGKGFPADRRGLSKIVNDARADYKGRTAARGQSKPAAGKGPLAVNRDHSTATEPSRQTAADRMSPAEKATMALQTLQSVWAELEPAERAAYLAQVAALGV